MHKVQPTKQTGHSICAGRRHQIGMTLVEVSIAMGLVCLLCAGLYSAGIMIRRIGEKNRLATEARSLAKERIEEMIAYGFENITKPSCQLLETNTLISARGYRITRTPHVIWHTADTRITTRDAADYAEVHVDVAFISPVSKHSISDRFSTLIQ